MRPVIWYSQIRPPKRYLADIERYVAKLALAARQSDQFGAARQTTWDHFAMAARLLFEGLVQGFHSFPPRPVAVPLGSKFYQRGALYRPPLFARCDSGSR